MNTCGTKHYATCVYYELELPSISSLTNEDCVTIEQTTQDLYNLFSQQAESIDVSGLQTDCLEDLAGNFTLIDILKSQKNKICELENKVSNLENQNVCDLDITNCNLDLTGLVDDCGDPVTNLGQLLQILAQNQQ